MENEKYKPEWYVVVLAYLLFPILKILIWIFQYYDDKIGEKMEKGLR